MRDKTNPYSSRDWGLTIGSIGLMLLFSVGTLCGLLGVAACIYWLVTGGHPGYILMTLLALGFTCILGSATAWAFTSMVDS